MFAIGRDGETYSCDSFKSFHLDTLSTAIALYIAAPVLGIHNMYMRFYPDTLRKIEEGDTKKDKLLVYVPNVRIPSSKYTLSLSSDKDIPMEIRKVFQILSLEDSHLPSSIPNTLADILYVENLPEFVKDIQRFCYAYNLPGSIDILEAEIDRPSGCSLRNPYSNLNSNDYERPVEKLGSFFRFLPVHLDMTSQEGFGYILQEDFYQFIKNLEGSWKIVLSVHNLDHEGIICPEPLDIIEFCGWNCELGFFDLCYYISITSNILNRLDSTKQYSAKATLYQPVPGYTVYHANQVYSKDSHMTTEWEKDQEFVDICFDTYRMLKVKRLIQ